MSYEDVCYIENRRCLMASVDSAVFELFKTSGSFEGYEYFEGNKALRENQKKLFLSGEIENPTLDYPRLSMEFVVSKRKTLESMNFSFLPDKIKTAYIKKVTEKLGEVRLIEASIQGDMNLFKSVNDVPDKEIFFSILLKMLKNFQGHNDIFDQYADQFTMLKALLANPRILENSINIVYHEELMLWLKKQFLKQFEKLFQDIYIDETKEYDAEEIKSIFEKALKNISAQDLFHVECIHTATTAISVSQEKSIVKIPSSRVVSGTKLVYILGHEIGVHVARRVRGESSNISLLGLGLDGYLSAEEGITSVWREAYYGYMKDFSKPEAYYLAIGLALGLDGIPRNFREVFQILREIYLFRSLKKRKNFESSVLKAEEDAWNRCIRIFRGTDCATKGVAYTKDQCYFLGNIKMKEYMTKIWQSGEDLPDLFQGKYDPTNEDHMEVVRLLS